MPERDIIPELKSNKLFPIGDAIDSVPEPHVAAWLQGIYLTSEPGEYMNRLNSDFEEAAEAQGEAARRTHDAAIELCDVWSFNSLSTVFTAGYGYRLAVAFNHQTGFLPACRQDLSEQLHMMKAERGKLVNEFTNDAWASIARYPHVYEMYKQLELIGTIKHSLRNDFLPTYRAGLALSFMCAFVSELEETTPEFTSMAEVNGAISEDQFPSLFIGEK